MANKAEAPCHVRGAFNPTELLTCEASCWVGVLKGLAPQLPVQLHCEPQELEQGKAMPIFANTIKVLENVREVDDLVEAARDHRARLKFRLSGRGKFIHRNRYPRRQAICTLHGEMLWLFIESTAESDLLLDSIENDNWNGYRSKAHPSSLSRAEMEALSAAAAAIGARTHMILLTAGDILAFDGQWWHATCYDNPVLNMFFTPGKDMEVAVKEHKRRMAMPMQSMLKVASISMAKCSQLSKDWQTSADGKAVDWVEQSHASTTDETQPLCTM